MPLMWHEGIFSIHVHISKRWKVETSLGWGGDIFPLLWLFLCLQPYYYGLGIKNLLPVFFHWQESSIWYQFQVFSQLIIIIWSIIVFFLLSNMNGINVQRLWWDIVYRIPCFLYLVTWLECVIVINLFPGLQLVIDVKVVTYVYHCVWPTTWTLMIFLILFFFTISGVVFRMSNLDNLIEKWK